MSKLSEELVLGENRYFSIGDPEAKKKITFQLRQCFAFLRP